MPEDKDFYTKESIKKRISDRIKKPITAPMTMLDRIRLAIKQRQVPELPKV